MFKKGDLVKFVNCDAAWWYSAHCSGDKMKDFAYCKIHCSQVPILEIIDSRSYMIIAYAPTHDMYITGLADYRFTLLNDNV